MPVFEHFSNTKSNINKMKKRLLSVLAIVAAMAFIAVPSVFFNRESIVFLLLCYPVDAI